MKKILLLIASAFLLASCTKKNEDEKALKVYSIIHEEEMRALAELFTRQTGIPVTFMRSSTGEIMNRVIVEKDNPSADVLFGGASSYHIQADREGALEVYASPLAASVPQYAKSDDNTWTGFCVLTLGIGVNSAQYEKKFPSVPLPSNWDDLLNPAYKGEIVATNPVSSSTAYIFLQNQLQRLGWDAGWDYLAKFAPLVGQFPDSGSTPSKLVGTGEYVLGVSYVHALEKYRSQGFDVKVIVPPKTAADVDCISILKNSKNLPAAKKFVDFMLGKEAQELMSSIDFTIPVNVDAKGVEGSTPLSELDVIDYDTEKASEQKNDVLSRWSKLVK